METILTFLALEIEIQERHLNIITAQKNALIACNRLLFRRLHADYETLLTEFELHVKRRAQIMPPTADAFKKTMATWPSDAQAKGAQMLSLLRDMLASIQQQSQQNRALIDNERRLIEFELGLIIASITNGTQYAQNGAKQARQINRLVNQTV